MLGGQAATRKFGDAMPGADIDPQDYGFGPSKPPTGITDAMREMFGMLSAMGRAAPMKFKPDVKLDPSQVEDRRKKTPRASQSTPS